MDKIVIQTVKFKASAQLEKFVKQKVAKLFEQDSSIIKIDITLFEGGAGNPNNQFCEIQISVPGENHFIKKNSESYEKSVLIAVSGLQKVLRRKKTKKITQRRKEGSG